MSVSKTLLQLSVKAAAFSEGLSQYMNRSLSYKYALRYVFKQRPDDIFLVTYPKSGTTLLQMMLYQLTSKGEMDFFSINEISPWFEWLLMQGMAGMFEKLPSPRFFKSHAAPFERLPRHGKIIYMARDVRDVAVSAYHHQRMLLGRGGDLTHFVDDFLVGELSFGSWFKHIESWWPHRNDPNVLFLRYEDAVTNLEGTVREVARFCNLPLDEAELPRIVERCGFEFMKKHTDKFDPRKMLRAEQGDFIRKGEIGEGRISFTPEQTRQLAALMDKLATRLGCSPSDAGAALLRPQLELKESA